MTLQTLPKSPQPKEDQKVNYSFQVVCSVCHKTISYSGTGGEVHLVKCDQCEGI